MHSLKGGTSSYKRIWPYIKPYQGRVWLSVGALIIAAVTVLSLGYGVRILVDYGFESKEENLLNQGVLVLLCASLLLAGAACIRTSTTAWLAEKITADLRTKLFRHLLQLDQTFFEGQKTGDLLSRLYNDTTLIHTVISTSAALAFRSVLQAIGAISLLVLSSPKLSFTAGAVISLVLTPIVLLGKRVKEASHEAQRIQGNLSGFVGEVLSAISTVHAFRAEERFYARYLSETDVYFKVVGKRIWFRAFLIAFVIGLSFSAISFVLWIGGRDVLSGEMTAGELSKFIFYAVVAAGSLSNLGDVLGELHQASGALNHIFEAFYAIPQVQDSENPRPLKPLQKRAIQFERVTFYYSTRPETAALKEISFEIKSGEKVALVGSSGAGKSTIFQLLLRFYDIQSGSIRIGEQRIQEISLADLRSYFAYVPQDPVIFHTSLFENLALGASFTLEDVTKACEQAYLSPFIKTLPKGFETPLGERGVRLSGGQRQRLALARALLLKAPILLLDEATSALDATSEAEIQKALEEVMKNRTTLIIAHRLSTVLKADRILVLDRGKIVEEGNHVSLLKKKGFYAALAEKQLFS